MLSVCLYMHIHQPRRIKPYRVFDVGADHDYFNADGDTDLNNYKVLEKVAQKAYLPAADTLEKLLEQHPDFCFALSFSGVVLEQMEEAMPGVLARFQQLAASGRVEILADTYYHSLAFFRSREEFERQVQLHQEKVEQLFGQTPRVFRHVELAYRNDLAQWAEQQGYDGIMAEGWDPLLGWRSPNFLYRAPGCERIKLLLKNYRLSDDVAFRFSDQAWAEWPLDADRYADWIHRNHGNGQTVNLFMDFETFGEHQWAETGIFEFLEVLPGKLLQHPDTTFKTPSQTVADYEPVGEYNVPHVLTWADTERDLSAWMENEIQQSAIAAIYELEDDVLATGDPQLLHDWRTLQTSDHFYYMCTKFFADGDVHAYFNPYETPYDAYIAFMNVLHDLRLRIADARGATAPGRAQPALTP